MSKIQKKTLRESCHEIAAMNRKSRVAISVLVVTKTLVTLSTKMGKIIKTNHGVFWRPNVLLISVF